MKQRQHFEYEKDFYAWALRSADLIRQKKFSELDIEHVAEELEGMAKSDKRALINRLAILLAHLLKWHYQPERLGNSWKFTIKEQRMRVLDLIKDSPSLNHELELKFKHAYDIAKLKAAREMEIAEEKFPVVSPFSLKQCLDINFFPVK